MVLDLGFTVQRASIIGQLGLRTVESVFIVSLIKAGRMYLSGLFTLGSMMRGIPVMILITAVSGGIVLMTGMVPSLAVAVVTLMRLVTRLVAI
uniref:Uncharacterized protein n=1 Tax=Romanomermis culicivorax TaxID=13658 RepID=A0A915I9D4_ROMCU